MKSSPPKGVILCDEQEIGRIEILGGEMRHIWGRFSPSPTQSSCRQRLLRAQELQVQLEDTPENKDAQRELDSLNSDNNKHKLQVRLDNGSMSEITDVILENDSIDFQLATSPGPND